MPPGVSVISLFENLSHDITSGRVHLDVWGIDEQRLLQSTGLGTPLCNWILGFLTDRTQSVRVNSNMCWKRTGSLGNEAWCPKFRTIPFIKKPGLDPAAFTNFRPISKLLVLSKILEKKVHRQLMAFLKNYSIPVVFQSGFKYLHSTE